QHRHRVGGGGGVGERCGRQAGGVRRPTSARRRDRRCHIDRRRSRDVLRPVGGPARRGGPRVEHRRQLRGRPGRRPAPAGAQLVMSDSAVAEEGLLRTTAPITAWNLVSRVTGFVRVIAIGAALGTTFLGNTYQSSNLVSNILFELLAAGLLSSVLVPTFVGLVDDGRRDDAERVAGAVLGVCLVALGVVLVAGIVLRPWVMR